MDKDKFDSQMRVKLLNRGLDPKQVGFFLKEYHENATSVSNSRDVAEWALKRGFFPDRVEQYGLTEENYKLYLPDYSFFLMHPYNNHFKIWVNDKLTLKYILNNSEFKDVMPEYYLYIENDGSYTYLMDAPEEVGKNEDFLLNLLKDKKVLAMKPNNGSEGIGFIKFEWDGDSVIKNGEKISVDEYKDIYLMLRNYTVTEYINQCAMLKKIWSGSECALRVTMMKVPQDSPFAENQWVNISSYARIGTSVSGSVSNLDAGGVCVYFDFDSGIFREKGRCCKKYQENETSFYTRHPDTNVSWGGKKLSYWEKTKEEIIKICKYISSLDYLGFDIIITDGGFKICEINTFPLIHQEDDYLECEPYLMEKNKRKFFENKGYNKIDNSELYQFVLESGGI